MYDKMNLTSMNVCESGLIDLNDAAILGKTFQVEIDDDFFSQCNGLITKGKVEAEVVCDKINADRFHFEFHSFGVVSTPCDRCLDDVELRIDVNNELYVAMADEDNDEGEIMYVNRNNPEINLKDLVYQFVVLSMPIRRVHEPGMCNEAVMKSMRLHQVARSDDEDMAEDDRQNIEYHQEDSYNSMEDPRWEKLKSIFNK